MTTTKDEAIKALTAALQTCYDIANVHDIALIKRHAKAALAATSHIAPDAADRDWPEDFAHENGNYMNTCTTCKNTFMGYKRRLTCKVCAAPDAAAIQAIPHEMGYQNSGDGISTAYVNGWNDCRQTVLGAIPDDPTNSPAIAPEASELPPTDNIEQMLDNDEIDAAIAMHQAVAAKPEQVETAEPAAAWMTEDGQRVVSAHTMNGARRDGGAMLTSMKPYSVALGRIAANSTNLAAAEPVPTDLSKRLREHDDPRLYHEADVLMSQAADEIDCLRASMKGNK